MLILLQLICSIHRDICRDGFGDCNLVHRCVSCEDLRPTYTNNLNIRLGSGSGPGNPYGLAASMGVFLVPLLFLRVFAPTHNSMPYIMCNVSSFRPTSLHNLLKYSPFPGDNCSCRWLFLAGQPPIHRRCTGCRMASCVEEGYYCVHWSVLSF